MLTRRDLLLLASAVPFAGAAKARGARPRILGDDFRHGLARWVVEAQAEASVTARNAVLDIDSAEGVTLWFREPLRAPVRIDYEVLAVSAGEPHDAVSDVNAFWMATDPAAADGSVLAHRRSGTFADYDLIRTYYIGIGGNRNTTTRMRRYIGTAGDRPILPEHDRSDAAALLIPNRWMRLTLTADAHGATVARDGARLFTFADPEPYLKGHFGLRTTRSHLRVRNFRIVEG
jgi:hypothetical protein